MPAKRPHPYGTREKFYELLRGSETAEMLPLLEMQTHRCEVITRDGGVMLDTVVNTC